MPVYTIHVPENAGSAVERVDRAVFVRDSFSVWGLVFGWLYLLRHRIWIALAIWLVLAALSGLIWWKLALPIAPLVLLSILAHIFVGVEGNDLRRWALERRGLIPVDLVSASRRTDAEYVYFHRQPDELPSRPAAPVSRVARRDMMPAVIGMFPDESTP